METYKELWLRCFFRALSRHRDNQYNVALATTSTMMANLSRKVGADLKILENQISPLTETYLVNSCDLL